MYSYSWLMACSLTCKAPCIVFQAAPQLHDVLELKLHIHKHEVTDTYYIKQSYIATCIVSH